MDANRNDGVSLVRDQTTLRVALAFALMSSILLLILLFVPSDRTEPSVLVGLYGLVILIPFAMKSRMKSSDYFEIIYPISFLYFLSFCYRGIVIIANPADLNPAVNGFSAINKALGFGILGLISMYLGYYCLSSNPGTHGTAFVNRFLPDEWRAEKAIARVLFLFIVGISLQIIWIIATRTQYAGGGSDSISSIFGILAHLSTLSLVLFSLFVSRRKASKGKMLLIVIVWCSMLLSQVLAVGITGSRGDVMIALLVIPLFCFNYARKHISLKWLISYSVLTLVLLIIVIMPLARPLRITRITRSSGSISEFLRTAFQGSTEQTLEDRFSEFSQRQIILENFAAAISKTPDMIPYKNGGTFLSVVSNLIPRFIWSDKVTYSLDREFSHEYMSWQSEYGGTGVTNIGELYINFGVIGLIIGMFILGLLYKSIYRNFIGTQAVGDLKILVYYCFLSSFIWIEGSLGFLFYDLILKILILIAVIIFLRINFRTREQPGYSGYSGPCFFGH